jgi:hypothetical protein
VVSSRGQRRRSITDLSERRKWNCARKSGKEIEIQVKGLKIREIWKSNKISECIAGQIEDANTGGDNDLGKGIDARILEEKSVGLARGHAFRD